jgi:DNA-binding IclR family transcriptional regulator
MSAGQIAKGVLSLLEDHIESYEQLRVLLLLREARGGPCTAKAIATRLTFSLSDTEEALAGLARAGLVQSEGDGPTLFGYGLLAQELRQDIDRLAEACKDQTLEVMRLMSKNATDRVRTRALQTFGDAFAGQRRRNG